MTDTLVTGGGIAGLAVATALAQQGWPVCVLEQAEAIKEVGAGLQISPNGMRVLRALGCEEALVACSMRGSAVSLRRAEDDRQVARLDLSRLGDESAYHFVHRADLIGILAEAARRSGVKIRMLQHVSAVEPGATPWVQVSTGAHFQAGLVIDAGGLRAPLRSVLNGGGEPFFTGQVAWRALVPNDGRAAEVHLHMAGGGHVVSYPLRGGDMLNIVAVQERKLWAEEGWAHEDDPANLRRAFEGSGAALKGILERVEAVNLWGLFRHPVARNWVGENVAMLGDAAHPTLPFLAQGANLALEDAWVLAACLGQIPDRGQALKTYQSLRRERACRVIEAANGNAKRYHLKPGPIRFGAHLGLSVVSTLAPRAMLMPFKWLYDHDVVAQTADLADHSGALKPG